ncbi:MBL fold metallo-hydrolase [Spirochaeta isovalerica]|uniref:Glyoxylase-like metal-dependent hydrolase (Beta-lactamase superfamily II) n=1 Tax=Spirochaeta isovalerica TaxID=150 RepID=A0A841R4E6_9SPIO|nr:MBL fold metallo-hydrolase [Spirochaeta isovalerica]MBB6478735.1 glyoxylase-like metal-dependent hydrolase (beta-lactamase superfamily II) [Spirochaeta isovalerica]
MKLIAIPSGPIETNAWLLINDKTGEAVLFDAPPQSYELVQKELENYKCTLKGLFITHSHWDHMLDTFRFAEDGVPVYGHEDGSEFMENPQSMSLYAMPGLEWKGCSLSNLAKDREKIEMASTVLEVRTAPGHCPGSIVIYIEEMKTAITGDVIFRGSIGRTDLPGGSFDMLKEHILKNIYTLPGDVTLCPGHGPETTVRFEMTNNPYVRPETI